MQSMNHIPSCALGDLSLVTDEQLDPLLGGIKIKCEGDSNSSCGTKRKLADLLLPANKRSASIKREPGVESSHEPVPLLRVECPNECALHDSIFIQVNMPALQRTIFRKTTSYMQNSPYNGIYFESEERDSAIYLLLLELITKDNNGQDCNINLVQSCEKCKGNKREIINTNNPQIVSDQKGIASIPISLHEQSAHIFPDYNGGKIKENMKFFIRATIFVKFDANFTQLKAVDSEGIKVVAQGKLKQKNTKIDIRKIKSEPVAQAILEDVRILPNLLAENAELKEKVERMEKRIEEQQMRLSHLENFMLCLMQSSQAPVSQAPLQPSTTEEVNNPPEAVQQYPEGDAQGLYFFSEKLDFSFVDQVLGHSE